MANSTENQDQSPDKEQGDEESLKKLEEAIKESDPGFQKDLNELAEIAAENHNFELVDIDKIIEEEKQRSLKARIKKLMVWINVGLSKLVQYVKWKLTYFLKEEIPKLIKKIQEKINYFVTVLKEQISKIKSLSKTQKIVLVVLLIGLGTLTAYFFKMFKGGIISKEEKPFINSLEELSEKKYFYSKEDLEDFYSSPRFNQNLVSLRRVVVNIKRSKNSSSNPMGAFEFFLQGNSSEVLVEVSDRESEIVDLFQNEIRDFSYDELDSVEGKAKLTEVLKMAINQILVRGKINKIYFKTFVLKN
ncbi:MAG: flagellar basal body-associated FliL family protein [Bdellovibrionaceae bacterium]|nr:flagellar basal body-associated FliL family protein [Pseudobdellovibrionaceae bacterium]